MPLLHSSCVHCVFSNVGPFTVSCRSMDARLCRVLSCVWILHVGSSYSAPPRPLSVPNWSLTVASVFSESAAIVNLIFYWLVSILTFVASPSASAATSIMSNFSSKLSAREGVGGRRTCLSFHSSLEDLPPFFIFFQFYSPAFISARILAYTILGQFHSARSYLFYSRSMAI